MMINGTTKEATMNSERTKFEMSKYGPKEDPRHHHVKLVLGERTLLGTVKGIEYNYTRGCFVLDVFHFNGEPWPIRPTITSVSVIR